MMPGVAKEAVMTPTQLRRIILRLEEHQPITEQFERALARRHPERSSPWYRSQKQHWLGWLAEYNGPGFYGRQRWDRSAAFVYNHIVCAPMVLWLGEAAGALKVRLTEAKEPRSKPIGDCKRLLQRSGA